MGLALKQIKTYAKLTIMVGIALAALIVIWKNSDNRVTVWFFRPFPETNVLWVMVVSGVSAVVITRALVWFRKVVRDMREIRKAKVVQAKLTEQRELAEKLKEQESRIDSKMRKIINQPGQSPTGK